jgi:ABC-type sugar transport system ATPase subunit
VATVSLRELSKTWPDGTRAVGPVSLEIASGEFMVLVGPSGCGKSTLLRLVAGLEEPSAGAIAIDGADVAGLEPRERDVAMVFQNYALYPHMTVRKNLEFPLRMRCWPRARSAAKVEEVAGLLGLADLLERKPRQLSGGQMQRVALGRALVREPRVFLFDEPLSNVDARVRAEMRAELKTLHRRLGVTMIYVTHDQVEAMTLGGRIAVMDRGRLEQVGPPLEVWSAPSSAFVAGFLGSPPMNLCRDEAAARLRPAGAPPDCLVGFRPESAAPGSEVEARVVLVEALGGSSLVHARAGRDEVVLQRDGTAQVREGDAVRFSVPREALHLFDAATRRRIEAPA